VAPKVIVRDENNLPIEGVTVIFSTLNLNGLPSSVSATTTQNGTITQAWTLGTIVGQQTLSAHVAGNSPTLSVTFTAMALPGNASQLEIISSEEDLVAGQRRALRIDVLDAYDNLVTTDNDRPILVEQVQGSGSVLGLSTISSQNGQAVLEVVGDKIGPLVLKASSTGLASDSTAFQVVLGDARKLTIVSGNSQTGVVASALPIQLSVRLTDAQNNPVSGVLVSPRIGSGGGTISGNQAVTNGDGLAIIGTWTLGSKAGEQTLIASVAGSNPANSVTFVATAEPGPPSKIQVTSSVDDMISGETETINLEVVDALNNPITTDDGRTITLEQTSGTGSITAPPSVTTQKGKASVTFTAKNIGTVVLKASSDGLTPAEVSFTIGVGNASKITIVEGNLQTAPVNTRVPIKPSVRLTDANDHPIPGVVIQFSVGSGAGSVTGASALTNSEGVATVGSWTLGSSPGEQTLVASLLGSIPALSVVITANANPSTAPSIQILAGDGQSAKVASAVAIPPSVLVKDAYNQALEGVDIVFSIQGGGGSIKPESIVKTDKQGVARLQEWVLGTTAGTNTLRAGFAQGLSADTVRFSAMGTVGSPEKITIIGPRIRITPTPASNLVQLPRALVTDAYDNPIPNVSVAFSISSGGGSIEPSVAVSESDGSAWVTKWTMGTTVGANTMIASIVGTSISNSYSLNTVATDVQRLSIVSGNEQIGLIGSSTKEELIVKAFDSYNNVVPNMILSWNITNQPQRSKNAGFKLKVSDSETQAQMSTTTDSTGTSKIVFVYGSLAGNYEIKTKLKEISGINDVLFTLTARPEQLSIDPNYPNPTPGDTFIPLNVPTNSRVTMEIFDVIGRKVRTLVQDQDLSAGRHIIALNRKDLASGTYIARVIALSQDGSVQKISKIFSIVNY
jgi:adhesin/invasin